MFSEVVKYRPENIQPDEFMRPPTEVFQPAVKDLCLGMEDRINTRLTEIVRPQVFPSLQLRMGSELELLLFSGFSNPPEDDKKNKMTNPNYTRSHVDTVRRIVAELVEPQADGGLGEILSPDVTLSTLFMEIRTLPGDVANYMVAMDKVQKWFQDKGKQHHVLPTVFSQHIHFSATEANGKNNFLTPSNLDGIGNAMLDTSNRAFPLVRLPENVESKYPTAMAVDYAGILHKGSLLDHKEPYRLEARIGNSEYAFDPSLNLLVDLIGLYRGLINDPQSEATLQTGVSEPTRQLFIQGAAHMDWATKVENLVKDPELPKYIPSPLLGNLKTVLESYWKLSRGQMTVAQARSIAETISENR